MTGKRAAKARKTHDVRTFGLLAIVASMVLVLVGSSLCRGWAMIHVVVSTRINAPPERVAALYADYEGWPQLFPATIRGVRLLANDGQRKTIEVDHATEGKVINIMTAVSPREIRLEEFKRRFDARFINRFEAAGDGTRYSIVAAVRLKGVARALGPPGHADRAHPARQVRARADAGRSRGWEGSQRGPRARLS